MASRQFFMNQWTNLQGRVNYAGTVLMHGSDPPTMGEGDPRESFLTPARADVGEYTLTTKDPFAGVYNVQLTALCVATTPVDTCVAVSSVTQNADGTWTIAFTVSQDGDAIDLADTDGVFYSIDLRNTAEGAP